MKKEKAPGELEDMLHFSIFDQLFDKRYHGATEIKRSQWFLKSFSNWESGSKGSVHTSKFKYITYLRDLIFT